MAMLLDANIRLGRLAGSRGPCFAAAQELLDAMDRFGVGHALVYSALARECENERGNRLLLEQIEGQPRLLPCWVLTPGRADPTALVRQMDQHKVRAARAFPRAGHFSVRPWCLGPLADALDKAGKVLLLDFGRQHWSDEAVDWEGVLRLCEAFPSLPVVVCGVAAADPGSYTNLLPRCHNLHLEISQLSVPGEIRRLAADGLAPQLVFGSDMPTRHIGAPLNMLRADMLTDEARAGILGGNLARLLALDTDLPATPAAAAPSPAGAIDAHLHLGTWDLSTTGSGRAEGIVREMNRCGVAVGVATSLWACYGEVALGNQTVANACRAFPGRIYGYLTLDPKHPKEVEEQLARHGDNPRFVGVKIHSGTHGVAITDSRCEPILGSADRKGWPILLHGGAKPDLWRELCAAYPRAAFIVAHIGGAGPDSDAAVELAALCREVGNLYVDVAASTSHYGFLTQLTLLAGADKVLFGTDHPLFDFGYELGQVLYGDLNDADRALVLAGNARRIFRLPE